MRVSVHYFSLKSFFFLHVLIFVCFFFLTVFNLYSQLGTFGLKTY